MTNPIEDIESAEVILVAGSNTTENHPVLSSYIKRAVKFKKAQLIVIDPRQINLTRFATKWLRPKPGTNTALLNGIMHVIIQENLHDRAFISERTEGFDSFEKSLETYTPETVCDITGIPARDIIETARIYAKASPASILYCMGITQHTSGTDNVKTLASLAMLCGNIGVKGGGVNPLRGQNNVQGACDMGGLPDVFPGYRPVTDKAVTQSMEDAWQTQGLSTDAGLTATQMIPEAGKKIKALYIIGENPMVSDPDIAHVEQALERLDFLVVQDLFLSETAQKADLVLPSACFAEKKGTFTNTERKIQRVRQAVVPPGLAQGDWQILCALAQKMNAGEGFSFTTSREIMEEIARVTPSYAGISYDRLEKEDLRWPCPGKAHPGTPILHTTAFTRGKGAFFPVQFRPSAEITDTAYPMILTTGRLLYHYHTGTMTMKTKDLNVQAPENFLEICRQDAAEFNLENGSMARITSRRGTITARVKISPKAVRGTVFIPFHFAKSAANRLTNAALDPVCKIPELKVCAVTLAPLDPNNPINMEKQ
jgi:formate dehydrogenase alpha subunit